jgi:primosomal protein N'
MPYFDYEEIAAEREDRTSSWDESVNRFLEQSQQHHRERLDAELEKINRQLDRRDELHDEIVDALEWKVEWYTDRLDRLYLHGRGKLDGKRQRLQDRIEAFYQELRNEHRQHWRDRQNLEQERREVLRELAEADAELLSELL